MRVRAIAAHPDDETLGCGGTLLKHARSGDELFWLVASTRCEGRWTAQNLQERRAHIANVTAAYPFQKRFDLNFPDSLLETVPVSGLMDGIIAAVSEVRPEIVYCVHGGDIHTDHAAVYTAAMSVFKLFWTRSRGVRRVLCYETISSTEAAPSGHPQHKKISDAKRAPDSSESVLSHRRRRL